MNTIINRDWEVSVSDNEDGYCWACETSLIDALQFGTGLRLSQVVPIDWGVLSWPGHLRRPLFSSASSLHTVASCSAQCLPQPEYDKNVARMGRNRLVMLRRESESRVNDLTFYWLYWAQIRDTWWRWNNGGCDVRWHLNERGRVEETTRPWVIRRGFGPRKPYMWKWSHQEVVRRAVCEWNQRPETAQQKNR